MMSFLIFKTRSAELYLVFFIISTPELSKFSFTSSDREEGIRSTNKTRNLNYLRFTDLRFKTPTRRSCDLSVYCISLKIIQPDCSKGYLENSKKNYIKISFWRSQCRQNSLEPKNDSSLFYWFWGSDTKSKIEIQRCRFSTECLVPRLALKNTQCKERGIDVCIQVQADKNNPLECISVSMNATSSLKRKYQCSKTTELLNQEQKLDGHLVKEKSNDLFDFTKYLFYGDHKVRVNSELETYPLRRNVISINNLENNSEKPIVEHDSILRKIIIINKIKIGNKRIHQLKSFKAGRATASSFSKFLRLKYLLQQSTPRTDPNLKPHDKNKFVKEVKNKVHYKLKDFKNTGVKKKRFQKVKNDSDISSKDIVLFKHKKTANLVLSTKNFKRFQRVQRSSGLDEAQDLAILMQDENDVDKEKIAEMIASDFASSLGMDKPVVSSGKGSKMEHDFAKFDSALKNLKAEKEIENSGIDMVETLASKEAQENIQIRRLRTDVGMIEKKLIKAQVELDKATVDYDANTNPKMAQMLAARKTDAEEAVKKLKENLKKLKENYKSMKQETEAREPKQPQRKLHGLVVIDPMWGDWSPWSKCSAECGNGGFAMRNRDCDTLPDVPCTGVTFDMKPCNAGLKCEAEWQDWGEWGPCSVSCGKGVRARSRICMTGDKEVSCKGESSKLEKCDLPVCESPVPVIVVPASDNLGSVSSASGPAGAAAASKGIPKPPMVIASKGTDAQKTFPYSWGMWGEWSSCSKSCGEGRQRRIRYCLDDSKTSLIRVFKKHCGGIEQQSRNCMGSCNGAPVAAAAMVGSGAASIDYGDMAGGAAIIERDGELGPRVLTSGEGEAIPDKGIVMRDGQSGTKIITLQEKKEEKEEDSELSAETVIFIILLILCVILIIIGFCIWLFSRIEDSQLKSKMKTLQTLDTDDTDGGAPVYGIIKPAKKLGPPPPNKQQKHSDIDMDDSDSRRKSDAQYRRKRNSLSDISPRSGSLSFEDEHPRPSQQIDNQKTSQKLDPSSVSSSPAKRFLSRWFKAGKAKKAAAPAEDKSEPSTDRQSMASEPESKKMLSWFGSKDKARSQPDQARSGRMERDIVLKNSSGEESGEGSESIGNYKDLTYRDDLQRDVTSSDETTTGESGVRYMESSAELGNPYEFQPYALISKLEHLASQPDNVGPGPGELASQEEHENQPKAGSVIEDQEVSYDSSVEHSQQVSSCDTALSMTGTFLSYSSPASGDVTDYEEANSDYSSDATTAQTGTYSTGDTSADYYEVDRTETDVSEDICDRQDDLVKKDIWRANTLEPVWEERPPSEVALPLTYRTESIADSLNSEVYPDKTLETLQDIREEYNSENQGSQQDEFQECNIIHHEKNNETPYHSTRGNEDEEEKQEQTAHLSKSFKPTGREKSMTNLSERAGLQSREPSTLWLSALISESDKKLNDIEKEIDHVLTDECHLPVGQESPTLPTHGKRAEKAEDEIKDTPWNEDDTRSGVNASELTDLSEGVSAENLKTHIKKRVADNLLPPAEITGTGENSEAAFKSDKDETVLQNQGGISYEEKKTNVLKMFTDLLLVQRSLSRTESLSHTLQGSSSVGLVSMSQQSTSDPRSTKYNSANNTGSAAYYMLMEQDKNQDTSSWTTGDTNVDNEADAAEMESRDRAKSNNKTANRWVSDESSTSTWSWPNDKLKGRMNVGHYCSKDISFKLCGHDGCKQPVTAAKTEREVCSRNYGKSLPTPTKPTDRNTWSVRFADEDKSSMIDDLTNQIALNLAKELSQTMLTKAAQKQSGIPMLADQVSAMKTANIQSPVPGKSPAIRFDLGVKGHGLSATKKIIEEKVVGDLREKQPANLSEILNEELDKFLNSTKSLTTSDPGEIQINWSQGKSQQQVRKHCEVQSQHLSQGITHVKKPMRDSTVNLGKSKHQNRNSVPFRQPVSKMSLAGSMTPASLQKPDPISGITRQLYKTNFAAQLDVNQLNQMRHSVLVQSNSVRAPGNIEEDMRVPGIFNTCSKNQIGMQQLSHIPEFGIKQTVKRHPGVFQPAVVKNKPLVENSEKPVHFTALKSDAGGKSLTNQCVLSHYSTPIQQYLIKTSAAEEESDKTQSPNKFLTIPQSQKDSDQEVYTTPNHSPIRPASQRQTGLPHEALGQLLQIPPQQRQAHRDSHGVKEITLDSNLVGQWLGVRDGLTQSQSGLHSASGQLSCLVSTMMTPLTHQADLNESFNTALETPGSTSSWRSAQSDQICRKYPLLHSSVTQTLPQNILHAELTETKETTSCELNKPIPSNPSFSHCKGLKEYASEPQRFPQAILTTSPVKESHFTQQPSENLSHAGQKADQSDHPSSGSSLHTVMSYNKKEQMISSFSELVETSDTFLSCGSSQKAFMHRSPLVTFDEFEEMKGVCSIKPMTEIFKSAHSNDEPEVMTEGFFQLDRTQNKCSISVDDSKSTVADHSRKDKAQSISILWTDTAHREEIQKPQQQCRNASQERSALSLTAASCSAMLTTAGGDSVNMRKMYADSPLAVSTCSSFIQASFGDKELWAKRMENKSVSSTSTNYSSLSNPSSDFEISTQYLSQSSLDSEVKTSTKSQTTPSSGVGTSTKYLSQSESKSDWETSSKSITVPNLDVEISTKFISTSKSDMEISTKSISIPNSNMETPTKYLSLLILNPEEESSKVKTDISLRKKVSTVTDPYLSLPTPSIQDHLQGITSARHEEISTEEIAVNACQEGQQDKKLNLLDSFQPYSDSLLYDAEIIQIKHSCTSENLDQHISHPAVPLRNRRLTYTSDSPVALKKPFRDPVYFIVSQGEAAGHQGAGDLQTLTSSDSSTSYPSSCDRKSDLRARTLEMEKPHKIPISKFEEYFSSSYDDFNSILPTSPKVMNLKEDFSAISISRFSSFSDLSYDQQNYITFPLDHEGAKESTLLGQTFYTTSWSLIKKDVNILADAIIDSPEVSHIESGGKNEIQCPVLTPLNLSLSRSSAGQDTRQEKIKPEELSDPADEMSLQQTSLTACSASLIHRLSESASQFRPKESDGLDTDDVSMADQILSSEGKPRVIPLNLVSDSACGAVTASVLVLAAPSTLPTLDRTEVLFAKQPEVESSQVIEKSFRTCHSLKPQFKVDKCTKPLGPVNRKQVSDTIFPKKLKWSNSRKRSDHTSQSQAQASDLFQRQIQWSPIVAFVTPAEENIEFPSGNFQSYQESCRQSEAGATVGLGDLWLVKSSITDTVIPDTHKFEERNRGLELETPQHVSRQPSMFPQSGIAETLYRTEPVEFLLKLTGLTSQKDHEKNSESNTLSDVSSMVFDKSSLWHVHGMSKTPEGKDHVLEKIEENSKTSSTDDFTAIQSLNPMVEYKDILKILASKLEYGIAEPNQFFETAGSCVSDILEKGKPPFSEKSCPVEAKKESMLRSDSEPHTAGHKNLCLNITRQQSEKTSMPLKKKPEQVTECVKTKGMKDESSYYPQTSSSRQKSSTLDKVPTISTSLSSCRTFPTNLPTEHEKITSCEAVCARKEISREASATTKQLSSHGLGLEPKGKPALDDKELVDSCKSTKSCASTEIVASGQEPEESYLNKLITPTLYRVPVETSDVEAQPSHSLSCKENPVVLHSVNTWFDDSKGKCRTTEPINLLLHITDLANLMDPRLVFSKVMDHRIQSPEVMDHTVDSPDVRDHTLDPPDVRDHTVDSPDVRHHTLDSPKVRDYSLDSPDVRDHALDSPDGRDYSVDSPMCSIHSRRDSLAQTENIDSLDNSFPRPFKKSTQLTKSSFTLTSHCVTLYQQTSEAGSGLNDSDTKGGNVLGPGAFQRIKLGGGDKEDQGKVLPRVRLANLKSNAKQATCRLISSKVTTKPAKIKPICLKSPYEPVKDKAICLRSASVPTKNKPSCLRSPSVLAKVKSICLRSPCELAKSKPICLKSTETANSRAKLASNRVNKLKSNEDQPSKQIQLIKHDEVPPKIDDNRVQLVGVDHHEKKPVGQPSLQLRSSHKKSSSPRVQLTTNTKPTTGRVQLIRDVNYNTKSVTQVYEDRSNQKQRLELNMDGNPDSGRSWSSHDITVRLVYETVTSKTHQVNQTDLETSNSPLQKDCEYYAGTTEIESECSICSTHCRKNCFSFQEPGENSQVSAVHYQRSREVSQCAIALNYSPSQPQFSDPHCNKQLDESSGIDFHISSSMQMDQRNTLYSPHTTESQTRARDVYYGNESLQLSCSFKERQAYQKHQISTQGSRMSLTSESTKSLLSKYTLDDSFDSETHSGVRDSTDCFDFSIEESRHHGLSLHTQSLMEVSEAYEKSKASKHQPEDVDYLVKSQSCNQKSSRRSHALKLSPLDGSLSETSSTTSMKGQLCAGHINYCTEDELSDDASESYPNDFCIVDQSPNQMSCVSQQFQGSSLIDTRNYSKKQDERRNQMSRYEGYSDPNSPSFSTLSIDRVQDRHTESQSYSDSSFGNHFNRSHVSFSKEPNTLVVSSSYDLNSFSQSTHGFVDVSPDYRSNSGANLSATNSNILA